MKKLLLTTALASTMAFAHGAMANDDETETAAVSLLQSILANTSATQASLINAAENLATIDVSVTVQAFGATGLEAVLAALSASISEDFSGMFSEVAFTYNADGTISGAGEFYDPAAIIAALATQVDNISTTAIGALNTGIVGNVLDSEGTTQITASTMALMNASQQSVAKTTSALSSSTTFAEVNPVQIANLALNNADLVNASVSVQQLLSNIDGISTTGIGALNTGNIAMDIATNTASLTHAIVGN